MFGSIHEIKAANFKAGYSFFDPAWTDLLRGRVFPTIYLGRYFITSYFNGEEEFFRIREAWNTGEVSTVEDPNALGFSSQHDARAYIYANLKAKQR